jgi:hypothetical protein
MSGAIPPLPQHAFMAWCLVKAQGQLYLYLCRLLMAKTTFKIDSSFLPPLLKIMGTSLLGLFRRRSHVHPAAHFIHHCQSAAARGPV